MTDQLTRIYHVRRRLTNQPVSVGYNEICVGAKSKTEELCDAIDGLRGVVKVRISRYSVELEIAPSFRWDEVEPSVLKLIEPFEYVVGPDPPNMKAFRSAIDDPDYGEM